MCITAKGMHLAVALVTVCHLARLLLVLLGNGLLYRGYRRVVS